MKISILGVGAFGIALARLFNYNDNKVTMWTKFKEELDIVLLKRQNPLVLPDIKIPEEVIITDNLEKTIDGAEIIVLAVPGNAIDLVSKEISAFLKPEQVICIVTKSIDTKTNKFMSELVYENTRNENICMLAGPSFAVEVANYSNELGFVVASKSVKASLAIELCLENENIDVVKSKDIIGVQIAAATKNVFAILLGMLDTMKASDSTRACVLTRMLKDLKFIIEMLGGKESTVFTYAGVGDLLLTCMSSKSRNYRFGMKLGEGLDTKEALEALDVKTVEGVTNLKVIKELLSTKKVKVKSIEYLYDVIYNGQKTMSVLKNIK